MTYAELVEKLKPLGLAPMLPRDLEDGSRVVYICRLKDKVVPYHVVLFPLYLDNGDATEIDEETYDAIVRHHKRRRYPTGGAPPMM